MPTFHYYMHQLRTLPTREIFHRTNTLGKEFIQGRINRIRARLLGTVISDSAFIATAFQTVFPREKALLDNFRRRTTPFIFPAPENTGSAEVNLGDDERARIISRADAICDHTFSLLGSGPVSLGPRIDWHRDIKSGYRWNPRTYYSDILIPYGQADIKLPWELSRFGHAIVLGQAYWLAKDEKYAREFISQVNDWIESNAPQYGVNWACPMDVAIRVCNWIAGYAYFRESPSLTDEFLLKFLKSLYQHGLHIRGNLENSDVLTTNHYLSNIAGLVYLGVMFPEFKDAAAWREFGISELVREMTKQVYPDGCDFEASTCYHRLVLELFFFSTLVAVTNDGDFTGRNYQQLTDKLFGKEYHERLYRMFEAVLFLLKPDGRMPQIGDNDNGMLHQFASRGILDMRYLLTFGAIFFNDPKFKIFEFGFCEEALWVFGAKGITIWQDLKEQTLAVIASHSFPDAGWYIMRHEQDHLIISCGPNGQNGIGGHAHNDKLSFELFLDGRDILIDPGTYLYTPDPEARDAFRSTSYHNTVSLDGLEQNTHSLEHLFAMGDEAQARTTRWFSTPDQDAFEGEHAGYNRHGFHHSRSIRYDKLYHSVVILDEVKGEHPQSTANFHFHPDRKLVAVQPGIYRIDGATFAFSGHHSIDVVDTWYSAEYGTRERTTCLRVHFGEKLETRISRTEA